MAPTEEAGIYKCVVSGCCDVWLRELDAMRGAAIGVVGPAE